MLANVRFICKDAGTSSRIDILGGHGASASSNSTPGSPGGSFTPLNSVDNGGTLVADSVVINCVG